MEAPKRDSGVGETSRQGDSELELDSHRGEKDLLLTPQFSLPERVPGLSLLSWP